MTNSGDSQAALTDFILKECIDASAALRRRLDHIVDRSVACFRSSPAFEPDFPTLREALLRNVAKRTIRRKGEQTDQVASRFGNTMPSPPASVVQIALRFLQSPSLHALARITISYRLEGKLQAAGETADSLQTILAGRVSSHEPHRDAIETYLTMVRDRFILSCEVIANDLMDVVEDSPRLKREDLGSVAVADIQAARQFNEMLVRDSTSSDWTQWEYEYRTRVVAHLSKIEVPDLRTHTRLPYEDIFVKPVFRLVHVESLATYATTSATFQSDHGFDHFVRSIYRNVILGDPGAGKSTISSVVAVLTAQTTQALPFVVQVRQLRAAEFNLAEYLRDQLSATYQLSVSSESVERLLREGRAVIIFDGMDESRFDVDRRDLAHAISGIGAFYPHSSILVTSRIVGYQGSELNREHFSTTRLLPLTPTQISDYVGKWFRLQPRSEEDSDASALDFLEGSSSMPDLISNPLLLTFILTIYEGRRSIPRTRSELYRQCIDLLLGQWDKRRRIVLKLPPFDAVRITLARIAHYERQAERTDSGMTAQEIRESVLPFITEKLTKGDIAAASSFLTELIDLCRDRAWMFTDVGKDTFGSELFSFTHASFREYFAASYTVNLLPESKEIADHILLLAIGAREEIYSQVCLALHAQNSFTRGAQVVRYMLQSIRDSEAAGPAGSAMWSSTLEYVIRLSDATLLESRDIADLVNLAFLAVDNAHMEPLQTLLSVNHQNSDSALTFTAQKLGAETGSPSAEATRFAATSWYLTGSEFEHRLDPTTSIFLRRCISSKVGDLSGQQYAADPDAFISALMANPNVCARLGALHGSTFEEFFSSLFERSRHPNPGPTSVASLIFDSFTSSDKDRSTVPAATSLLRLISRSLDSAADNWAYFGFPENLGLPVEFGFSGQRVAVHARTLLRKTAAQDRETKRGAAFFVVATIELIEHIERADEARALASESLERYLGNDPLTSSLNEWQRGERLIWFSTSGQASE